MYVYICIYVCIYMYICMYVYIYIYIYECILAGLERIVYCILCARQGRPGGRLKKCRNSGNSLCFQHGRLFRKRNSFRKKKQFLGFLQNSGKTKQNQHFRGMKCRDYRCRWMRFHSCTSCSACNKGKLRNTVNKAYQNT